jgi:acyl-[acyl-carrier-protein]-phospholipid O-acyltransferase/long-chain-fatty-acid--[acyl-carrier-protein] ligase
LILPYLILSPVGGRLAIIYSKIKVFRFFKLLEIPIMLFASLTFYYQWTVGAIFAVLLMGIQSCLYSPSKYSLIRDIGGETGVAFGSGVFESMAFLGILIGTVTASVISDYYSIALIVSLFLGLASLGYYVTLSIKAVELPENKDQLKQNNPFKFLLNSYRFARGYSLLNSGVFGAASFWLIGGMLQMNLVIHSKNIYHASNTSVGLIMAGAAIGIAIGTFVAGKIKSNAFSKGLILMGMGGMALLFALLAFFQFEIWLYAVLVVLVSFMGGVFQVPNLTLIQQSDVGRKLGDMIAYLNLVTFIFVLIGTFLFWLVTYLTNENSFMVFRVILFICLMVSYYFLKKSPVFIHSTINYLKFIIGFKSKL